MRGDVQLSDLLPGSTVAFQGPQGAVAQVRAVNLACTVKD